MIPAPPPVDSVLKTIGRTPLVRLQRLVPGGAADVFVKLEYFSPTGSYKDRMALARSKAPNAAAPCDPACASSNTPAAAPGRRWRWCAMKGYEFHRLSSDAFAAEKLDTMRAFGADLEIVPSDGGKVTLRYGVSPHASDG